MLSHVRWLRITLVLSVLLEPLRVDAVGAKLIRSASSVVRSWASSLSHDASADLRTLAIGSRGLSGFDMQEAEAAVIAPLMRSETPRAKVETLAPTPAATPTAPSKHEDEQEMGPRLSAEAARAAVVANVSEYPETGKEGVAPSSQDIEDAAAIAAGSWLPGAGAPAMYSFVAGLHKDSALQAPAAVPAVNAAAAPAAVQAAPALAPAAATPAATTPAASTAVPAAAPASPTVASSTGATTAAAAGAGPAAAPAAVSTAAPNAAAAVATPAASAVPLTAATPATAVMPAPTTAAPASVATAAPAAGVTAAPAAAAAPTAPVPLAAAPAASAPGVQTPAPAVATPVAAVAPAQTTAAASAPTAAAAGTAPIAPAAGGAVPVTAPIVNASTGAAPAAASTTAAAAAPVATPAVAGAASGAAEITQGPAAAAAAPPLTLGAQSAEASTGGTSVPMSGPTSTANMAKDAIQALGNNNTGKKENTHRAFTMACSLLTLGLVAYYVCFVAGPARAESRYADAHRRQLLAEAGPAPPGGEDRQPSPGGTGGPGAYRSRVGPLAASRAANLSDHEEQKESAPKSISAGRRIMGSAVRADGRDMRGGGTGGAGGDHSDFRHSSPGARYHARKAGGGGGSVTRSSGMGTPRGQSRQQPEEESDEVM